VALRGKRELFADEVHPNVDGAKIIAETVKRAIQRRLVVIAPVNAVLLDFFPVSIHLFAHATENLLLLVP